MKHRSIRWGAGVITAALLLSLLSGCEVSQDGVQSEPTGTTESTGAATTKPEPLGDYSERTYTPAQAADYLRYHGRTAAVEGADKVAIDWTYSGFSFRADLQGELKMKLSPAKPQEGYAQNSYVLAILDGEEPTADQVEERRVRINKSGVYTLLTDVPAGVHDIRLVKLTEPQLGILNFEGLTLDGQLMDLPEENDRLTIEFIGDSITSGLGNLWGSSDGAIQDNLLYQDGYHAYEAVTARRLDADFQVVSLSGWGIAGGWTDDPADSAMKNAYPYTSYYRNHTSQKWDFSRFRPEVVVINLGTNDAGIPSAPSSEEITKEAANLLKMVADNNPGARIYWAYGMMGRSPKVENAIKAGISEFKEAGGGEVTYVELPQNQLGGGGHPNVAGHKAAGKVLADAIEKDRS